MIMKLVLIECSFRRGQTGSDQDRDAAFHPTKTQYKYIPSSGEFDEMYIVEIPQNSKHDRLAEKAHYLYRMPMLFSYMVLEGLLY